MSRLFGTDGIRGIAGNPPLDDATIFMVGVAAGTVLSKKGEKALIGIDTRESGLQIASIIAGGLSHSKVECHYAGIIPTPAVAYLTKKYGFDIGVIISASHNPYRDNGIKIFGSDGMKLSDEMEDLIESELENIKKKRSVIEPVDFKVENRYAQIYHDYILETFRPDLNGLSIVVDLANGAMSEIASEIFRQSGARLQAINYSPDGKNINDRCGSLHLNNLSQQVKNLNADMGIAFDGDGDRCLGCDERGNIIDGDTILYHFAKNMIKQECLKNKTVVATVMSNFWLEESLKKDGIKLVRTKVGDRYVLEAMLMGNHPLGGEQSGHIINLQYNTTGDGLITSLLLCSLAKLNGRASELLKGINPYPQRLINIPVNEKPEIENHPVIGPAINEAKRLLDKKGRVLVRYSGTENIIRIMAEARDETLMERVIKPLSEIIVKVIGG